MIIKSLLYPTDYCGLWYFFSVEGLYDYVPVGVGGLIGTWISNVGDTLVTNEFKILDDVV